MNSPINNSEIENSKHENVFNKGSANSSSEQLNVSNNNFEHKKKYDFKAIYNQSLKNTFSVADAKYAGDCKCSPSKVIEVIFSDNRKKLFKNDRELKVNLFQYVIVQLESGLEFATVIACGKEAEDKQKICYRGEEPELSVIRHAHNDDLVKVENNKNSIPQVLEITKKLIQEFKLDMKITGAEWQFDRQRLTIFFTAPQRIDFRELVKEMARNFKTRIELRQISTREEARRIGGMGPCGLNICCSSFANEFCHVTLDHARDQHLANNVSKLSGYCGRLKCCLLYEHDHYLKIYDKYPAIGSSVKIAEDANAILYKIDVFKEIATLFIPCSGTYKHISGDNLKELQSQGKITPPKEDFKKMPDIDEEELSKLEADY